jgi:hypothetical protein
VRGGQDAVCWNSLHQILICSDPERRGKPLSRSSFNKMWSKRLPFVKVTHKLWW